MTSTNTIFGNTLFRNNNGNLIVALRNQDIKTLQFGEKKTIVSLNNSNGFLDVMIIKEDMPKPLRITQSPS
jgi:hypothetical protein